MIDGPFDDKGAALGHSDKLRSKNSYVVQTIVTTNDAMQWIVKHRSASAEGFECVS